jgi:predicted NUDIX family NTP pyrophosphohydrolase
MRLSSPTNYATIYIMSSNQPPRAKKSRISAGLLMYRVPDGRLEVFLAHPGGPFFARKDDGHWTIPKGEGAPGEGLLTTAVREFTEEVGLEPRGEFIPLGSIQQKGGKIVHAWAFRGEWAEERAHHCNTFAMEWPPASGKIQDFPEIDRVGFFSIPEARKKLKETQHAFLDRLMQAVNNVA